MASKRNNRQSDQMNGLDRRFSLSHNGINSTNPNGELKMQAKAKNIHAARFQHTFENMCCYANGIERAAPLLGWIESVTANRPNAEGVIDVRYRDNQYFIGGFGERKFIANHAENWIVVDGAVSPIYFNTTATKFEDIDGYK